MSAYTGWTFEVAWVSNPGDASPTWADMTGRVRGSLSITRGRTAEQTDIQPGTLTVSLDNADHVLTAGNPLSSVDVQLGKRCRVRETVGGTTYDRYTGYLTDIDPDVWTDSGAAMVRLTFTDLLDLLARSPQFVSTLGANIMSSSSLRLYYPLNDSTTPFQPLVGSGELPVFSRISHLMAGTTVAGTAMVEPSNVAGPPGDDVSFANFTPIYFDPPTPSAGSYAFPEARNFNLSVPVAAGETVALSVWMRPAAWIDALNDPIFGGGLQDSFPVLFGDLANGYEFGIYDFLVNGAYAQFRGPSTSVQLQNTGMGYPRETWRLVTARFTMGTGAFTLWIGSDVVLSGTMASPPTSATFTYMEIGETFYGSLAHLQVHVGVNAFPYAEHLAQFAVGMTGLERQSTGQRVTTLAGYAGVTDLAVDAGGTQMQVARLAGTTPGLALADAARAENADLYATGSGTLRFRGRAHRYNQTPTATLAKAWLDDGLRPRVDGPIYNTFDATRNGVRARAVDAASIAGKGVKAGQLEVDTMQASELAAVAGWRTLQYAAQRNRVPALPITLLHQTDAVRNVVLSLDIGDRADLAGMPADYPAGADKLVIEGYTELIGEAVRQIVFVTSPVLGLPAGTAGRWFQLDSATLGVLDSGTPLAY